MTGSELDADAFLIRNAVQLMIRREFSAAREVLGRVEPVRMSRVQRPPIGVFPPVLGRTERSRPISGERALAVFRRDHWSCCYCGRLLIHAKVLELVGVLAGDAFAWVSHHLPMDRTHAAIERLYPNVEHVLPLARGGENDPANLRAACTPCNEWKGDCTLEEAGVPLVERSEGWDGLEPMLNRLERIRTLTETHRARQGPSRGR